MTLSPMTVCELLTPMQSYHLYRQHPQQHHISLTISPFAFTVGCGRMIRPLDLAPWSTTMAMYMRETGRAIRETVQHSTLLSFHHCHMSFLPQYSSHYLAVSVPVSSKSYTLLMNKNTTTTTVSPALTSLLLRT